MKYGRLFFILPLLISAAPNQLGSAVGTATDKATVGDSSPSPSLPVVLELLTDMTMADECTGDALAFDDGAGGGPSVTFVRNSSKWCRSSSGLMTLLAANEPVVEGGRSRAGLSIEPAGLNEVLENDDLSTWTATANVSVSANSQSGPWGGTTMDTVTTTATSAGVYQCPTGTAYAGPYTFSGYGRSITAAAVTGGLLVQCLTGAVSSCSCAREDGATCTANINGLNCYASTSLPANTALPVRVWTTAVCSTALTQTCAAVPGRVYLTTSGSTAWGKLQYERASVPSSPIDTGGTVAARAADVASFTAPANFETEGCFSARVGYTRGYPTGDTTTWAEFAGGSALRATADDSLSSTDGANTATKSVATMGVNGSTYARTQWDSSAGIVIRQLEVDGTPVTYDGTMGATNGSTVYLGSQGGTTNFLNGNLSKIVFANDVDDCPVPDYFFSFLHEDLPPTDASFECAAGRGPLYSEQGRAMTFTRASVKWCTRTLDGLLVSMASGDPAINAEGVVIEQGATNLNFRSHEFNLWGTLTNVSVSANAIAGPDNLTTAETLTASAGNAEHRLVHNTISWTTANNYTISVYAKPGTVDFVGLSNTSTGVNYAVFNLGTGTVHASGGTGNTTVPRITGPYFNGYYRLEVSFNVAMNTGGGGIYLTFANTGANAVIGTTWNAAGTETVHAWGAQAETSYGATSVISTASTTANRTVDVLQTGALAVNMSPEGCAAATILMHRPWSNSDRVLGTSTIAAPATLTGAFTWNDMHMHDSTSNLTLSGLTSLLDRSVSFRSWWRSSTSTMGMEEGGSSTSVAFDGSMGAALGAIWLGSQNGSASPFTGNFKDVRFGSAYSSCEL